MLNRSCYIKIMIKKTKMVLIEWIDSRKPSSDWEFLEKTNFPKICKCITIGFLLKEDQTQTIIASNLADIGKDEQVMGIMTIPSCSITKLVYLKG